MTVVAASLLWPIADSAYAREFARLPPLDVAGIRNNLIIAAEDRAESRFAEILADYLAKEEADSGLILIGAAEDHEIESARKFSTALKKKLNLRVVLISTWGASSVPAFDGVVIDASNQIVANFSMKRIASPEIEKLASAAKGAFSKIRHFSTVDRWLEVMLNQVSRHPVTGSLRLLTSHHEYLLKRSYGEVSDEVSIFKIGSDRPNWVFIDSSSPLKFNEQDAEEFDKEISDVIENNKARAVILHSQGRFFPFKGGRACERSLTATQPKK